MMFWVKEQPQSVFKRSKGQIVLRSKTFLTHFKQRLSVVHWCAEGYFYTSLYQMSAHCDLLTRRTARAELALKDTLIQSQHVSIRAKQTQDGDTGTHWTLAASRRSEFPIDSTVGVTHSKTSLLKNQALCVASVCERVDFFCRNGQCIHYILK